MAPGPARPPFPSSASSSGSDRSSSMPRSSRSGGSGKRSLRFTDPQLVELAANTQDAINWNDILRRGDDESGVAQWKWLDDMGAFRLYCKQEPLVYSVLASAILPCSVPELVHLLHAPSSERYLQNMEALHGEEFRDGAFVHRVDLRSLDEEGVHRHPDMIDLSVKSAIFGNNQKWSFVDAAYRRDNGESFEKLTTTVHPRDVEILTLSENSSNHHNYIHSITTSFLVVPDTPMRERATSDNSMKAKPWKESRIYFYGELAAPASFTPSVDGKASSPFDKHLKQRMLTMARSCERLTELVRRRRLGLQTLPERKSSLFSASSSRCVCCNKSLMLLGVKHCKICVQTVCSECSHKHERETRIPGSQRMLLEDVRVCDRCMDRVDRGGFPELDDPSLLAPIVVLHPMRAAHTSHVPMAKPVPASAPGSVLTELLNKELLEASSNSRKASVMSVIKQMMDQEQASSQTAQPHHPRALSKSDRVSSTSSGSSGRTNSSSRGGAILLTPANEGSESDYVRGLDKLNLR